MKGRTKGREKGRKEGRKERKKEEKEGKRRNSLEGAVVVYRQALGGSGQVVILRRQRQRKHKELHLHFFCIPDNTFKYLWGTEKMHELYKFH